MAYLVTCTTELFDLLTPFAQPDDHSQIKDDERGLFLEGVRPPKGVGEKVYPLFAHHNTLCALERNTKIIVKKKNLGIPWLIKGNMPFFIETNTTHIRLAAGFSVPRRNDISAHTAIERLNRFDVSNHRVAQLLCLKQDILTHVPAYTRLLRHPQTEHEERGVSIETSVTIFSTLIVEKTDEMIAHLDTWD